ncbi:DUF6883 domain-containing protein [Dyadobacter jiangsuensis]|uniref:DUF6883 domain-containing protein n=1 Tax=Dyadobacter jiangsuensis TaxID=1591085 RepID=UPI0035B5A84D
MSKLPNCSEAVISRSKIEHYLLNPAHCEGKSKAMFFSKFGYSLANSSDFHESLRALACESLIIHIEERPPFGTRITTEGTLHTPDLRNPRVRIGWFFDRDDPKNIPRLITVIPVRSK